MNKKSNEKPSRFSGLAQEAKDWKEGRVKWRTTLVEKDGARTIVEESQPEATERAKRSMQLKRYRGELDLTQAQMAAMVCTPLRTFQGWEVGRPIPEQAFKIAHMVCLAVRATGVKDYKGLHDMLIEWVDEVKSKKTKTTPRPGRKPHAVRA